jgi:hypothetical protein
MMQASLAAEIGGRGAGGDARRFAGDEVVPVVKAHVARLAGAQMVDPDHMLAPLRSDRRRKQRLGELLRRDDHGAGAAVVEDMLVVALGIGDVGRHGDAARRHDREIGDAPFRPVLGDQHDRVAAVEPDPAKRRRQRRDLLGRLAPARGDPGAILLGPKEGRIALGGGAREEHRDEVREMLELAHGRLPCHSPSATPSLRGSAAPTHGRSTRSIAFRLEARAAADAMAHAPSAPGPSLERGARSTSTRSPRDQLRQRDRVLARAASRPRDDATWRPGMMIVGPPAAPTQAAPRRPGVDDRRRHRASRPFAAFDPVRDRRPSRLGDDAEIGELVVEEIAVDGDAGAPTRLDRRGERRDVAARSTATMCEVRGLRSCGRSDSSHRRACLGHLRNARPGDQGGALREIGFVHQPGRGTAT